MSLTSVLRTLILLCEEVLKDSHLLPHVPHLGAEGPHPAGQLLYVVFLALPGGKYSKCMQRRHQGNFVNWPLVLKICYLESRSSTVLAKSALRLRASLVLARIQGGNLYVFVFLVLTLNIVLRSLNSWFKGQCQ